MKMTKKVFVGAMALLALVSTLSAKPKKAKKGKSNAKEITWMFWDDLEATTDLMSLGYAQVIERFNSEYEGLYHVTPITTNLEE